MDYFEKKQGVRIAACFVLVTAIVLGMIGVFSGGEQLVYPLPTQDATVKGFGGDVTAHVRLNDDQTVKTLTIDTPDETEGLGKRASEAEFTEQFIGKAAPFILGENGIEALSGATVTSKAAVKAINWAVTGEEPAPEATEEPKTQAGETAAEAGNALTVAEKGFGGDVTVHVEMNDDRTVKALSIDTPDETDGLGKRASDAEFIDQFIGKTGPFVFGENGIEALTGATVTSNAVLTAINKAIAGPADGETTEESNVKKNENEAADSANEVLQAIALSMGKENNNSYVTDYLEQDPYLVNIYEGYGFAKDYGSARGHSFTLEDVQKTKRPHAKANCLTCKTPDMHKMIVEQGVGVYSMPFEEVMAQTTNCISCYTCHGADDGNNGQMVVTHQYVNEALGENVSTINAASLSCGQCHIEYYFTPQDSETMMPYHSIEEMTPEAILAYYDGIGFYDWEQPGTGTKMLKAQHPELETWIQGKHASILSCADCHMATATTESGAEYHDHHLVSPLSSEVILNKCAACHGSGEAITARVREIQARVTGRETQVGIRLSSLKDTLTAAVEAGQISGEELEAVRKLHREAQWFFDFCYVENSEGAHNSSLATRCLDISDGKITEAFAMLASAGVETASETLSVKQEESASSAGSVTEQGFGGDVTVSVEMNEDGTVKTLIIDTPNETDGLGKRASEAEFTEQFIGKSAPFAFGENGIEALSGATITSTAALTAINKAAAAPAAGETPAEKTEEPAEEPKEEEKKEEPAAGEKTEEKAETAASDGQVYGSYRVTKENEYSKVTVAVGTKNGEMTSCKITSEGENDLLTDEIRGEWAKAILESGSATPDAVTGATLKISAQSVQDAVTDILAQINGGTAAPVETEEKTKVPTEVLTEEPTEAPAEELTEAPAEEPTEAPAEGPAEAPTEEPAEAPKEDTGAEKVNPAYGGYRADRENNYSKVTVIAGANNGKLISVKIISSGEQDLLTDELRAEWAKAILESGSATPDAVTGATLKVSAQSVQEAVEEILAKIAGE